MKRLVPATEWSRLEQVASEMLQEASRLTDDLAGGHIPHYNERRLMRLLGRALAARRLANTLPDPAGTSGGVTLRRRARALYRKLDTVVDVARSLLEAGRTRQSRLMEGTIIGLIVLEILMALL